MDHKKALEEFGFKLCNSIIDDGATYASIILLHSGKALYNYSTNAAWHKLYHIDGLSKDCHLIHTTKKLEESNNNFILFWDTTLPNNEVSIYLNEMRKEKNVSHGVSFCKKNNNGILEIFTIAGRDRDAHFSQQIINNKKNINNQLLMLKRKYLKKAPLSRL